jgi:predicted RNase H-like nuclease (RuvC/YqgF family)
MSDKAAGIPKLKKEIENLDLTIELTEDEIINLEDDLRTYKKAREMLEAALERLLAT